MREVGAFEARNKLGTLLDWVAPRQAGGANTLKNFCDSSLQFHFSKEKPALKPGRVTLMAYIFYSRLHQSRLQVEIDVRLAEGSCKSIR